MHTIKFFMLTIMLGLLFSVQAKSQTTRLTAGFALSNMSEKFDGSRESGSFSPGATAGLEVDFPIGEIVFFRTGIQYVMKGFQESGDIFGEEIKAILRIHYLDVPLVFKVVGNTGNISVFGEAGGYFGIGIAAKAIGKLNGNKESEKVDFGDEGLSRFDAGLQFGGGVEFNRFLVGLEFKLGLLDVSNTESSDYALQNRNLILKFGYQLSQN